MKKKIRKINPDTRLLIKRKKNPYRDLFEAKSKLFEFVFDRWYILEGRSPTDSIIIKFEYYDDFNVPVFSDRYGDIFNLKDLFKGFDVNYYNNSKFFGPFVNFKDADKFHDLRHLGYLRSIGVPI